MNNNIAALILTKNEEIHIDRCIQSIKNLVSEIYVIDSGSNDKTKEICERHSINFFYKKFYNHSTQFNWGLNIIRKKNFQWPLKIDADEILTPKLINEIKIAINNIDDDVSGLAIKRKIIFNNKILNFGGTSSKQLRIFKPNLGFCESKFMDEHIKIKGKVKFLREPFFDHNLKSLSWWTQKHNDYSNREVIDNLVLNKNKSLENGSLSNNNKIKRFLKKSLYYKLPIFIRPFLYFFFRYIILLGFLDGQSGLIYNFLQGFWYRFLIDVKIVELKEYSKTHKINLISSTKKVFDLDLN